MKNGYDNDDRFEPGYYDGSEIGYGEESLDRELRKKSRRIAALPVLLIVAFLVFGLFRFTGLKNNLPNFKEIFNFADGNHNNREFFRSVSNVDEFEEIGVSVFLPEEVEIKKLYILNGEIACADFFLNDKSYAFRAAKSKTAGLDPNEDAEIISSEAEDALEFFQYIPYSTDTYYKTLWSNGGTDFCLSFLDIPDEEDYDNFKDAAKMFFELNK